MKDPLGLDLVDKLLILDPKHRIDSDAALDHDFFWTDPMPCEMERLKLLCKSNFHLPNELQRIRNGNASHPIKMQTKEEQYYERVF